MKRIGLALLLALALPLRAAEPVPAVRPPAAVDAAPIALLVDLSAGQTLFERRADQRMLPASMTKAMSALIAFDLIKAGKLDERALITVRPETAARWAGKGTTLNLRGGEKVSVSDLLRGTTVVSANDAAVALAEGALGSTDAWVAAMNARARALGMKGSHFGTPSGFPDRGRTYVTARDLVLLAQALAIDHPQLYRRYIGQQAMDWRGVRLTSHDPFAGVLPGADGIKTGHTFEAGYNFLGAVQRDGRRLVLVIGGAWTEPGRASAAKALVEWGYGAWDSRPFVAQGQLIGEARVQQGAARSVPLAAPRWFSLAYPKGAAPKVTGRIIYKGPLVAPVVKGAVVASLQVSLPGQPDHFLPLVAARDIAPAGPIDRLVNGLLGLFS